MPRIHVPVPLSSGATLALPPGAARHVQVRRMQPGQDLVLFTGSGGEWDATITRMGRSEVEVRVGAHHPIEREAARRVHLATGLMASERLEWLIEKATELGAASLTPVLTARANVRVDGTRAERKRGRWDAVAAAACEQCGRNRIPSIAPVTPLAELLAQPESGARWLLTLDPQAPGVRGRAASLAATANVTVLSGPEGGLDPAEEQAALAAGFLPVHLGPRVLRAETAPLAALAFLVCNGTPG